MKIKLIALAIVAGAISGIADAQMSSSDQFIVQNYLSTHPELPQDKTQEIERKATLQEVINYVKGNSYYNGSATVSFPPIDTTAVPISTLTPATKPQAAISTDGEGEALTRANQERTAQQTEALQDAYRQRFAQLKGEALTRANQARTAQQTEALQDAYRTSAKKFNDEKGQALLEGNLKRTQIQSDALNAAKSEHEANQHQVDATQYRTRVNAQVAESRYEEFVQQTNANTADINTLNTGLKQAQAMGRDDQSRANDAYANTEANRQALQATNHRVADNSAEIANHEQRIEELEASNSANFGKLKNEMDKNRQRASAAISGVAAMANIPQVIQGQTFSVGAGVGTTDSESALAVGFSARAAEHVVVKGSVSDDTQQNFVVGGGVSYGW